MNVVLAVIAIFLAASLLSVLVAIALAPFQPISSAELEAKIERELARERERRRLAVGLSVLNGGRAK